MKIDTIIHKRVKKDGTFIDKRGAVETKGKVIIGLGKGCGLDGCHCSDGYWITILQPRTSKGVVSGLRVGFDNEKEFNEFLKNGELINL